MNAEAIGTLPASEAMDVAVALTCICGNRLFKPRDLFERCICYACGREWQIAATVTMTKGPRV